MGGVGRHASGSNLLSAEEGLRSQWDDNPPERFIRHVSQ